MDNLRVVLSVSLVVLFVYTFYYGVSIQRSKKRVGSTTGTIHNIFKSAGKHYASANMAQVGYSVDGKYYISKKTINTNNATKAGQSLKVKYFLDQPDRVFTKTAARFFILLAATIICILIYVCL